MSPFVVRCQDRARCRICDRWRARDWWVEVVKCVYIVRVCSACRATQTEYVQ